MRSAFLSLLLLLGFCIPVFASTPQTTAALAPGLEVTFPDTPEKGTISRDSWELSFTLKETSLAGEPQAYFYAGKINVPWWGNWLAGRASDYLAREVKNRFEEELRSGFPDVSRVHTKSTSINGFPAIYFEIYGLNLSPRSSHYAFIGPLDHTKGYILLVDNGIYIYGAAKRSNDSVAVDRINLFLDSIQTPYTRPPGSISQQQDDLYRLIGIALVVLLVFIVLLIIALVRLYRFMRKRFNRS